MTKRRRTRIFQKGDRDANESEITAVLKAAGYEYILLTPGHGADILLIMQPMSFLEVKNGDGAKLTETEKALKWHCEIQGIGYYVVRNAGDAAALLNQRTATAESE